MKPYPETHVRAEAYNVTPLPYEALTTVARVAIEMVERWGPVAGMPDGEDSTGRQRFRLATPEELVTRALAVAGLLVAALDDGGHLMTLPGFKAKETP